MFDLPMKIHEPKMVISQVTEALRELITSGRLKPAEKLMEVEIAISLGGLLSGKPSEFLN